MDNHLTLDYYNRHAERFTADTGTVNFMEMQNKFLNKPAKDFMALCFKMKERDREENE